MRHALKGILVLALALGAGSAPATPASGFTGTTIALGRFGAFAVRLISGNAPEIHVAQQPDAEQLPDAFSREMLDGLWVSFQRTMGESDLYVQNNVWTAGGTTGWHTHPGHSLIVVTAGAVTVYEGDDTGCTPHVYKAGMGFVDAGGDHVHVIRNETGSEARTVAVQLVPTGATRRIDAPANAACGF
jgi:quercetin dioxygenase-like cupin family protein